MNNEFENVIQKFKKINKMGYIKGINNNLNNSAGLTLEKCLDKKADSMFFPDYEGIEVKCTQRFSRYNIGLFSLAFDGPELYESNYLLENYGMNDNIFKENKKLIVNLKINKKVLVYNKYYFELKINYEEQKIFIKIYDIDMNHLEDRGFIYFDSLEKRINVKLSKLALFYASKKVIDNNLFFRYYKLECYKYNNFNTFINLLEKGDVSASLMLRFSRNKETIGKNKNKNIQFSVKKESVGKLFDKIYLYEN